MSGPVLLPRTGPGCWRVRRDGTAFPGLPAALAAVRTAWPDRPDLQGLAWALLPRLPGKPRTSTNLKTESAQSGLNALEDVVISDPWLAMNTENAVNVLWSETDKPGLRERLEGLANGGVTVAWAAYSDNGGGHAAIILDTPVVSGIRTPEEDRAMLRKLSLTRSLLTTAIDGDLHAGLRGMTKNPFSRRWQVEVGDLTPRSLDEVLVPLQAMAEAEGWKAPKRRYKGDRKREPSPEGRNCALFDLTRWWAGDGNVRDGAAILDFGTQVNAGFSTPLGHGEVASVARSITRFMVNRYDGRGCHVPLAPAVVKERQAAGRAAQAERQRAERDDRLLSSAAKVCARGEEPGQAAVAVEAGVSLRTVQAAWRGIWDRIVNNPQPLLPLSGSSATPTPEQPAIPPVQPYVALPALPETQKPVPVIAALLPPRLPRCLARLIGQENPDSLLRLVGVGDGSSDPGFLSRRDRAALVRFDRETWHRSTAKLGSLSYGRACAARWRDLYCERLSQLAHLQTNVDRLVDLAQTATQDDFVALTRPNVAGLAAAQERLQLARLGWSSKLAAEERTQARTRAAMVELDGKRAPRFRVVPDGLDLFLGVRSTNAA